MRNLFLSTVCGFALLAFCGAPCAQDSFRLDGAQVPGFWQPGWAGVVVGDFDGDGRDDVAFTGVQSTPSNSDGEGPDAGIILIVGYDATRSSYRVAQSLISDLPRLVGLAKDGSAIAGLVAVSRDGILVHYAGRPLQLVSHVALGRPVETMRVGDVDGDGRIDVVVSDATTELAAYDLATGALERTYEGRFASSIELAQLDADAALEIILAGTPGYVVDGATNATDWRDAGGFGPLLASGRILADHREGFIAAQDWDYLTAYQGQPYSSIWSLKSKTNGGVDMADLDGDGIDEILYSGDYTSGFVVLDALTQAALLQMVVAPHRHSGAARMRGDGTWQFAFGEGLNTAGGDTTEIFSSQGTVEFARNQESAPFLVAPTADLDGDGVDDGAWASTYFGGPYNGGHMHVYDPVSGVEHWQHGLLSNGADVLYNSLTAITVAERGDGQRADMVIAEVGLFLDVILDVIDGASGDTRQFAVESSFTYAIDHLAMVDGDTHKNILALGSNGAVQLGLFDGSDLHEIWFKTLDSSLGERTNDVQPLSNGSGQSTYLLSMPNALVAYDLSAREVSWSQPIAAASAATLHRADGTALVGVLDTAGHLRLLSIDGATALADFAIGASEAGALRDLPDSPGEAVACVDRRIVLVDIDAESVIAQSPWVGALACDKGNITLQSLPQSGKTRIRAGSLAGVFDLDLAGPEIFYDGFENKNRPESSLK